MSKTSQTTAHLADEVTIVCNDQQCSIIALQPKRKSGKKTSPTPQKPNTKKPQKLNTKKQHSQGCPCKASTHSFMQGNKHIYKTPARLSLQGIHTHIHERKKHL
jgi:hypothetical protein